MGKTYAVNWGKKSLRFNLPVFWKAFMQERNNMEKNELKPI